MKYLLILSILFLACNKSNQQLVNKPNIEIWGDNESGYTVLASKDGKEFVKWSDLAIDTTSMRVSAKNWYYHGME